MSLIKLKYVVSFTSQDKKHNIENLIRVDGSGRWLCAAEDRSGRLEAVLQLERACHISHIDIGTYRALCLTIQVGRSSWETSKEYKDLVVGTTMMSPAEARSGTGKNCMKMFKYESFCADARDEVWDRMKIILTQPFRRDVQFGLSLLRVMSTDTSDGEPSSLSDNLVPKTTSSEKGTPARVVNNKNSYSGPSWRSTEEIKRHFFKDQESNKREEEVKNNILKIGATAENGSSQGVLASRITKMVVAAAGKSPAYKPHPFPSPSNGPSPWSQATAGSPNTPRRTNTKLTFDEEVSKYLGGLQIENLDLNKMSFADLRHQLEKIKCRKLSKEEKKVFFAKTKEFIEEITSSKTKDTNTAKSNQGNKRKSSCDLEGSLSKKRQVIEKEDVGLADRLGVSPEERQFLTALESPQVKTNTGTPGSAALKKIATQQLASPPLKKGKSPLVMGRSFNVELAPTSKRAAFEAMLDGENDNGVFGYGGTPTRSTTGKGGKATPKSVKRETATPKSLKRGTGNDCDVVFYQGGSFSKNATPKSSKPGKAITPVGNATPKSSTPGSAVKKVKKSPRGLVAASQPAPSNVWLSKEVGVKMCSNSEPNVTPQRGRGQNETEGSQSQKGKKKKKSKGGGNADGGEMVLCPMCNEEFPTSKIQMHAAACGILSSDDDDDEASVVNHTPSSLKSQTKRDPGPGGFLPSDSPSFGYYLPSESPATPDMVECPVCFKKFPNWRIEHHTNKCLAAGKS